MTSIESRFAFHQLYHHADTIDIPYHPSWENGAGCFDNAVTMAIAPAIARSKDIFQRKILILPQSDGTNIVIFQRFKYREDLLRSNEPSGMDQELAFLILQHEAAKREQDARPMRRKAMAVE